MAQLALALCGQLDNTRCPYLTTQPSPDDLAGQSVPSLYQTDTEVEAGADSYLRGCFNMAGDPDKHYLPN